MLPLFGGAQLASETSTDLPNENHQLRPTPATCKLRERLKFQDDRHKIPEIHLSEHEKFPEFLSARQNYLILSDCKDQHCASSSAHRILGKLGRLFGMIRQRHPDVAAQLVLHLGVPHTPSLEAAASAARFLRGVQGFEPPSWEALAQCVRPAPRQPDEFEPGCEVVGNTRRHPGSRSGSGTATSSTDWMTHRKL